MPFVHNNTVNCSITFFRKKTFLFLFKSRKKLTPIFFSLVRKKILPTFLVLATPLVTAIIISKLNYCWYLRDNNPDNKAHDLNRNNRKTYDKLWVGAYTTCLQTRLDTLVEYARQPKSFREKRWQANSQT